MWSYPALRKDISFVDNLWAEGSFSFPYYPGRADHIVERKIR